MDLIDEPLPGVKVLKPFVFADLRGSFVKPFHEDQFAKHGIRMTLREEFFSTSKKNVIRGMHFQIPPHAHQKLIYCITGSVIDVVLDLRVYSPHYGDSVAVLLSAKNRHIIHIPVGFAHGFLSLEDETCLVYKTDCVHQFESEGGVLWNSFDHIWPAEQDSLVISERDTLLPSFKEFKSPF